MELIDHVKSFVSGNVRIASSLFTLIKLEAKLAGLSIFPVFLNSIMLLVVLMTSWIFAMVLLQHIFWILFNSFILSLGLILFLNVLLFFILMKTLTTNLQKMSFEKTREFFSPEKRQL